MKDEDSEVLVKAVVREMSDNCYEIVNEYLERVKSLAGERTGGKTSVELLEATIKNIKIDLSNRLLKDALS